MLSEGDQILDIDSAAARHWASVTQGVIFAPVVNRDAHARDVNNRVAVEASHRDDGRLPDVKTPVTTWRLGQEKEGRTVGRDARPQVSKRIMTGCPDILCWAPFTLSLPVPPPDRR